MKRKPIRIATRGSPLALAQANAALAHCREKFPKLAFELKIIKSSGDKFPAASLASPSPAMPAGIFTKELETALLKGRADMAIHSLKDLPTELPEGLKLGAVAGKRADPRDVLLYKEPLAPGLALAQLPKGMTVATSSPRRRAQLLALRRDFKVVEIRGNVATRLRKLAEQPEMDATILAAAGLARLDLVLTPEGRLSGEGVPGGLLGITLGVEEMLSCVGQAAIGVEIRADDKQAAALCRELNDESTFQCVAAERALLRALGGGCQMPLGALATLAGTELYLRAISFEGDKIRRAEGRGAVNDAEGLGRRVAAALLKQEPQKKNS
ncbi:MAG TPA: hydroxymethylbilane synthase [Verrucomicrobiae bacterium]|jgi:hydroxymethylbilane synthase